MSPSHFFPCHLGSSSTSSYTILDQASTSFPNKRISHSSVKQQQASCKKPSAYTAAAAASYRQEKKAATHLLIRKRPALLQTGLFLLSLCVYWNSLGCELVFDDVTAIRDNRDIRPHVPVRNLLYNDFWGTPMSKERSHKSYRPLTVLTFRWNYWISQLEPLGFHFVNVLLHGTVTVLYFRVCQAVVKATGVSLTAAVIFALHPIHTEAVTGVVGRAELLASIFFLSAILSYTKTSSKDNSNKTHWRPLLATIAFSALALLSKEQGVTSLAICAAYEILITQQISPKNMIQSIRRRKLPVISSHCFQRICILTASVMTLLLSRLKVMGSKPTFTRFDNPAAAEESPTRQLTQNYLVTVNAWLLLNPSSLCCDWTMGTIPLVTSMFDPRNLSTLLTYSAFICSIIITSRQKAKISSVITLCLCMIIIPFLPASNLFFPVGFVVAERVLYIPSMGFCLLISIGFARVKKRLYSKEVLRSAWSACLPILLIAHAAKTYTRNWDWRDEYSLFRSGLKVVTGNAKLFNNVGHALEAKGQYNEALRYFQKATLVQPDDIGAHINVGRTLNHLKLYPEAEQVYMTAKSLLPKPRTGETYQTRVATNHLSVFLNLATLISRDPNRLEEADLLYRQAISMRADYVQAYINRGDILIKLNRSKEAQEVYEKALTFEPDNPDLLYNMGVVMLNQNKTAEALQYLDKALEQDPDHYQALLNSAILIQESGLFRLHHVAFKRLQRLIDQGREDERVLFNLGMLSMDSGDHTNAEHWFRKAVDAKPDLRSALFNLALLLSESDRPLEGEPFLRQLIMHYPDHVKGLILLGDLYVNHLNDLEAAESCYRRILELDPNNVQGLHNLCVVFVETGRLHEAKECLQGAVKMAPNEEYIRRHLAIVEDKIARLKG